VLVYLIDHFNATGTPIYIKYDDYYFNINVINDPAVINSPKLSDNPLEVHVGASLSLTVSVTDP
jgi:hypothetical protein